MGGRLSAGGSWVVGWVRPLWVGNELVRVGGFDPAGELFLPLANFFCPLVLQRTTTLAVPIRTKHRYFNGRKHIHEQEVMFMGEPTCTE